MLNVIARNRPGVVGGVLAFLVFIIVELLAPADRLSMLRERGFDAVLSADLLLRRLGSAPDHQAVVVVDIDQRTIAALGDWPWPRETMARLVGAVAAVRPKALAIDVLFAGADMRSSAASPHRLDAVAQGATTYALASSVTEADQQLATVISSVPTALGSTLDTNGGAAQRVRGVAVLRRGPVMLADVWRAPGATDPVAALAEAAAGVGIMSLPGDADGKVRRVPLLAGVGDALRPGLAVEAVRLAQPASTLIVEGGPQRLLIGNLRLALPADGFLRLAPVNADRPVARTISALDVVQGAGNSAARLAGAVVLIGGSAPELNGLRDTPHDPLTPSVQIEANAIEQIAAQRAPLAAPGALQAALTFVLAAVALAVAVSAAPAAGAALAIMAIAAAWLGAIGLSLASDRLLDPLTPSIGAAMTFMTASIGSFVAVSRREARIRNRFAQHLAPEVVRRIAENPEMLKLRAEKREVTALFTDIEGFTSMTHRAGPEQLVAELDGYIEGVATIIMDNGGMVDKIVGDAVHALFNAPIDLPDHVGCAVTSAIAIRKWSEQYRARASARQIGFGRTRIGIETGEAIVGDIGIRSKLDYTAHGDAINSAARLEALNKELGSSICIGPVAASRYQASTLRPLGTVALRGLEQPIMVFEPWPDAASPEWRARYLAACAAAPRDPAAAAEQFAALAAELPDDPVAAGIARLLRDQPQGKTSRISS